MAQPPELYYPAYYADLLTEADVSETNIGKCSEIPNSSDTISREAAVDALDKRFDSIPMEQTTDILLLRKDLRELPSVQPEKRTEKRTETHACDLIDRQAAIDAIHCDITIKGKQNAEVVAETIASFVDRIKVLPSAQPEPQWIPCSERLPDKEFTEGLENGTVYNLYPCLVTRYATHSPVEPTRLYVAKHYYDGNDFVNNGEIECTEAVTAWMPLPEPWRGSRP